MQSVLQLQVYLLSLWEKGFATAAEPDENDAREAEGLRYELQQQEYALSQGSQQHLTYFNQQRGRLRALELRAYAQIDARYNGLLRRLSGCGTVLGACSDALKARVQSLLVESDGCRGYPETARRVAESAALHAN